MNARTTLKTVVVVTFAALTLGGSLAQADTTIEIQKRPAPGWNDTPNFPMPRPDDRFDDRRDDDRQAQVDQRQEVLMDRIIDGVEAGRLTARETAGLLRDQREIGKLERVYLADGFLSRFEWNALDAKLDAAERRIAREKHDYDRDR